MNHDDYTPVLKVIVFIVIALISIVNAIIKSKKTISNVVDYTPKKKYNEKQKTKVKKRARTTSYTSTQKVSNDTGSMFSNDIGGSKNYFQQNLKSENRYSKFNRLKDKISEDIKDFEINQEVSQRNIEEFKPNIITSTEKERPNNKILKQIKNLNKDDLKLGIILSEILGPPASLK